MKYFVFSFFSLGVYFTSVAQISTGTKNLFIVTIDGIRWQEIFKGPDPSIIANAGYTSNSALEKLMYLGSTEEESRKKLLPFFWNVISQKGRLYGNREYNNKVNVANVYRFSYPGYNEIFTGYPDLNVNSNKPRENLNINVLEYLNSIDAFKSKVVAFTSWNIFPYILNEKRSEIPVYSGYDSVDEQGNFDLHIFNQVQKNLVTSKTDTREDVLTFIAAKEYINAHKPRVVFIGFGECDEDAHKGRYDQYLQHLNEADQMIQQLWYFIQSTPEYRDKTDLIITTDHGRGKRNWTGHDILIGGSADAWLAIIGPDVIPVGELQWPGKLFQKQLASTIAKLLGYTFKGNHPVAKAIDFNDRIKGKMH